MDEEIKNFSQSLPIEITPTDLAYTNDVPAEIAPANILPDAIAKIKEIRDASANVDRALEAANQAVASADSASKKSAGWSLTGKDKKDAIEALQESGNILALGIKEVAEAQEKLFDNLTNLSEATKFLFGLGVMNIATTRVVIDAITKDLKDASRQKISERAKESLLGVVQQLKAQEDLFKRVDKISNNCKFLAEQIRAIKGNKDSNSDELSLMGLTLKIKDNHDALLEQLEEQSESVKAELSQKMSEDYKTLLEQTKNQIDSAKAEVLHEMLENNNVLLQQISKQSESSNAYAESLADMVRTETEKKLSEEKVLLGKKTSRLSVLCWILGVISLINLLISAFTIF